MRPRALGFLLAVSILVPAAANAAQDSAAAAAENTAAAPAESSAAPGEPDQAPATDQAPAADQVPQTDRAPEPEGESATGEAAADGTVRFGFTSTPWREVINWIADEAGLALHVSGLPPGSFSYTDPQAFTYAEAIDRINLFLLAENFTLVRSGRLLSVIDLSDQRSLQQLEVLAKLVPVDALTEMEPHHVVKCLFPLGDIDADAAVSELAALNLMTTPSVLTQTNQLLITDTVSKLRSVRSVLDAFNPEEMDGDTVVKSFALQHVDAEQVLLVARPHLGLATGEMIGIDVSLSADPQGKHIYVTGIEDKVELIENLVAAIDQPQGGVAAGGQAHVLESHAVPGGNLDTVYDVLQTLLADKEVRLSKDEAAGTIVALATPSVHREIDQTVTQLQASDAAFEVIPLKTIDPYFAISLLEQMLDLPGPLDDPPKDATDIPKIDADPGNMRLFVRAKPQQIEQIKNIIDGLERNGPGDTGDEMRILPMQGEQTLALLRTAATFWRGAHPVVLYPSTAEPSVEVRERVVNGQAEESASDAPSDSGNHASHTARRPDPASDDYAPQLLTPEASDQAPPIRCQMTPRGLVLQSDDPAALDRFEQHLRTLAGPVDSLPSPPVVFYLKHTKADAALRMLGELLDGADAAQVSQSGQLVNGMLGGGSFLGSMVTDDEGTTTMLSGAITVVADSRLNRLIAQGTAADIDLIENYLKIIDKDSSITSIETYGSTHVIELLNTRAEEVAEAIREAYPGRIAGEDALSQLSKSGDPRAAQQAAALAAALGKSKGGSAADGLKLLGKASGTAEPQISVAVHSSSNSLIITAPDQLFQEVEALVQRIDAQGEQAVEVISAMNSSAFEAVQQVLLGETPDDRGRGRSSQRNTRSR
ncbi:secretin N-terminal domain-containing protein [Roseimaritima sediminicola]|uniref:secretin N-terminal domain-containing protein n=1 Tax=Roseimaritima sediminicola TaxID=2662066 RepID=UPI001F190CF0|nr:secretin N-terminal domain-containing protein [Roseimaritima sediminicola]